jgi:glycosyltransferase involved in cell wall biosynthesis
MIYAKINSIPYYSYGHGPYKKTKYLILYKIIYKIILKLHSGYIAYNEYSKLSFGKLSIKSDKLHYINNTIKLYGNTSIEEKTGAENGILFLGRLRKNSGLNTLIDACEDVRKNGVDINLHIIGTGEEHDFLKSYAENKSWVKIYGKIFDHGKISEISKNCRIGCYPGSAGLSVVHYFALGLPPLVKKSMETHMGPEPAYVLDKINGFHFHGNEDLSSKLLNIFLLPAENYKKISHGSLETYKKLSIDNFAKSLQKIHEKNK